MEILMQILRFIGRLMLAIIAPFVVIVLGALVVGAGIYLDWTWVSYGGGFLVILGIVWIMKYFSLE